MVPFHYRHVPRAPLPETGVTCFGMTSCIMSEGTTLPSSLIRAHAPDQHPPASFSLSLVSRSLQVAAGPAGKWPFPVLSLQSLHGCLDPYPAAFPRCIYPFLPGELRPHVRSETFGTPIYSHIVTSVGHAFRGCSHSVMIRPPCLIDLQVAPTAVNYNSQGSRAVYTTQWTCGYPHELWYRYMPESGNWHGGTYTRWIAALPAAPQIRT
jgi:hypothetical protein